MTHAFGSEAVEIYGRIPSEMAAAAFTIRVKPNAKGLVGRNQQGWLEVGLQRGALVPIQWAAVIGDEEIVKTNWIAVEQAFSHQRPDGGFSYAPVIDGRIQRPVDEPTSDAFFISGVANVCLLLQQGPLGNVSRPMIAAVRPKIEAATAFLAQPSSLAAMREVDEHATNRLAYDSEALVLGAQLTENNNARRAGEDLLAHVLALQTIDGIFPEHGGGDSSYQAVTLLKLTEIAVLMPELRAELEPPLRRGAAWEMSRIGPDGKVNVEGNTRTGVGKESYFGQPKVVNYPEVIRALALLGALEQDEKLLETARRVAAYWRG